MNNKTKLPDNIRVVWEPLKGRVKDGKYNMSSQELVLTCPCDTIFMSSSRASGKTEVSLIKFALPIGMGYGSYYRGVYIDAHYKDLADVIARSKRLFTAIYGNKARFYSSKGDEKWVWDTGEELLLRQGCTEDDYDSFHGQEYAVILYNELTKNPSPAFFDKMRTTNRTSFNPLEHPYYIDGAYYKKYHIEKRVPPDFTNALKMYLPPLRPKIIITTNPSGAGKQWVKEAQSYIWDTHSVEDRPVKDFDHLMDATRYFVNTMRIVRPTDINNYKSLFGGTKDVHVSRLH